MTGPLNSFWETIREDRSRGSSELLRAVLDRLEKYLSNDANRSSFDPKNLIKSLRTVRPEMTILVNAGYRLESVVQATKPNDVRRTLMDEVRRIDRSLTEAPRRMAQNLEELENPPRRPVIFSRSGTILNMIPHRTEIEEILVLEFRPGEEGINVANNLADQYEVTFYYDLEALKAFETGDAFFIGADSFQADGFIRNKTGSRLLAHAGEEITVVSCFQLLKYEPYSSENSSPTVDSPDALSEPLVRSHPLFEWIPPEPIDWFVTEVSAVRTPNELKSQVKERELLRSK